MAGNGKRKLTIRNLREIFLIVKGASSSWREIGDGLGFVDGELRNIDNTSTLKGPEACFRDLLSKWLKHAPPNHDFPTIKELAQALRAADQDDVAWELEQQMGIPGEQESLGIPPSRQYHPNGGSAGPTLESTGSVVEETDLETLLPLLDPVAPSWDLFAEQLGVPHDQKEKIQQDVPPGGSRSSRCLSRAMQWWVRNGEDPTYERISAVLRGPVVTNKQLAKKVDQFKADKGRRQLRRRPISKRDHVPVSQVATSKLDDSETVTRPSRKPESMSRKCIIVAVVLATAVMLTAVFFRITYWQPATTSPNLRTGNNVGVNDGTGGGTPGPMDNSVLGKKPTMPALQLIKWDEDGKEESMNLIERIANKWKSLGLTFGFQLPVLNGFETRFLKDQEECCRAVIQRWLEGGSVPKQAYPVTWAGLIKALEDTNLSIVASELKTALLKMKKI